MYEVNQLSVDMNISNIEDIHKPMYNYFTNVHGAIIDGAAIGTGRFNGDLSDFHDEYPLEFNGYIPVVHEPTYIDVGSTMYFNPPPVFVPEVGVTFAFALFAWFIGFCREMR